MRMGALALCILGPLLVEAARAQPAYPDLPSCTLFCAHGAAKINSAAGDASVPTISAPPTKAAELDDSQLYVIHISSGPQKPLEPLKTVGFLTDTTRYLSLGIFFDRPRPGFVAPNGAPDPNATAFAFQPYAVTAATTGTGFTSITNAVDGYFIARGDMHALRVELLSVDNTAPNAVDKALGLFFKFLSPVNALLNVGPGTVLATLAQQKAGITDAASDLAATSSVTRKQVPSVALRVGNYGVRTALGDVRITIAPVHDLVTAYGQASLRTSLKTLLDPLVTAKADNQLIACSQILQSLDLGYGNSMSVADKAFVLGYVGVNRSQATATGGSQDALECVGQDLLATPAVRKTLVEASYNTALTRGRIDATSFALFNMKRALPKLVERFGADVAGLAGSGDQDRESWLQDLDPLFAPTLQVDDVARVLGPPAPANAVVSGRGLVQKLLDHDIRYFGCSSFASLPDGYAVLVAGLPKTAAAAAYNLSEVRGFYLGLAPPDYLRVDRIATTRRADALKPFTNQSCHPDAKPIGAS